MKTKNNETLTASTSVRNFGILFDIHKRFDEVENEFIFTIVAIKGKTDGRKKGEPRATYYGDRRFKTRVAVRVLNDSSMEAIAAWIYQEITYSWFKDRFTDTDVYRILYLVWYSQVTM